MITQMMSAVLTTIHDAKTMTLNGIIALILRYFTESTALEADYVILDKYA